MSPILLLHVWNLDLSSPYAELFFNSDICAVILTTEPYVKRRSLSFILYLSSHDTFLFCSWWLFISLITFKDPPSSSIWFSILLFNFVTTPCKVVWFLQGGSDIPPPCDSLCYFCFRLSWAYTSNLFEVRITGSASRLPPKIFHWSPLILQFLDLRSSWGKAWMCVLAWISSWYVLFAWCS